MMGADLDTFDYSDLDIFDYPNYTYPTFPNVSENYTVAENGSTENTSDNGQEESFTDHFYTELIVITECVIFIFGAVGNGAVIWLLGFQIKRNPFITYVLNLAVADLGVLVSLIINMTLFIFFDGPDAIIMVFFCLILLMYSASQFFMTVISIDRCAAVFFPLWYQCKRPARLTTIVCALIWVLSTLLTAISCILRNLDLYAEKNEECYQFIVNAVLCLPVMTIATVCLFIKFCFKVQQYRRGRLLTIVLLTLLFFLLFGFPLNVIYILYVLHYVPEYAHFSSGLLACLNSSVNPIIYFLVARQRKSRQSESIKTILQKVFKEEEICTQKTAAEIQLCFDSKSQKLLPLSQTNSTVVSSCRMQN